MVSPHCDNNFQQSYLLEKQFFMLLKLTYILKHTGKVLDLWGIRIESLRKLDHVCEEIDLSEELNELSITIA